MSVLYCAHNAVQNFKDSRLTSTRSSFNMMKKKLCRKFSTFPDLKFFASMHLIGRKKIFRPTVGIFLSCTFRYLNKQLKFEMTNMFKGEAHKLIHDAHKQ